MSRIIRVLVEADIQVDNDCDVIREVMLGKYYDTGIDNDEMILPKDGNYPQDEGYFRVLSYKRIEILNEKEIDDEVMENDNEEIGKD